MGKIKLIEARVLTTISALGVEANHLLRASESRIKQLEKAGLVDSEQAAVDYVKSIKTKVVELAEDAAVDEAASAGTGTPVAPSGTSQTSVKKDDGGGEGDPDKTEIK